MRVSKALLILFLSFRCFAGEPDFSAPKTYLGSADHQCRLNYWANVSSVTLSDGTALPFRFLFTTEPKAGVPVFGRFWRCPLLDSSLISSGENVFDFSTLGGRVLPIMSDGKGGLTSVDLRYSGKVLSNTETVISGDGWEYRFFNGLLSKATREDGVELEWIREGKRLKAISEKGKGILVDISYASGTTIPSAIEIGGRTIGVTAQRVPLASVVNGQLLVSGYDQSMLSLESAGNDSHFPIELHQEGFYSMKHESMSQTISDFTWEPKTGILRTERDMTYQGAPKDGPNSPFVVTRTNKAGLSESYFFDNSIGLGRHQSADGLVIDRTYFTGSGALFSKLRKVTVKKNDQVLDSTSWSYDETGRLLREKGVNFLKSYDWNPNGTPKFENEVRDGKEVSRTEFDENGRAVLQKVGTVLVKYTYEDGRKNMAKFMDGKLVFATMTGRDSKEVMLLPDTQGALKATNSALGTDLKEQDIKGFESQLLKAAQSLPK